MIGGRTYRTTSPACWKLLLSMACCIGRADWLSHALVTYVRCCFAWHTIPFATLVLTNKTYAALKPLFFWPHMCKDLEEAYIPSCDLCQRNKSLTKLPAGPLHPLPVPGTCGDSVTIDFVSPLPEDAGYNYLITMTDRLNSDICLVPTHTTLTAQQFLPIFF